MKQTTPLKSSPSSSVPTVSLPTYSLHKQCFALIQTLRCHAALIEDLLAEGFDFVLTVRGQSDALERRYS